MTKSSSRPGLCIVLETGATGMLAARIEAAVSAAEPVTVILAAAEGTMLQARDIHPSVEWLQARGIAVLIENDAALARTLRADGVHLAWSKDIVERYGEARDILGTRYMAGADAGRSRHDAMTLGEAGADYIAFGIPAHVEDRETAVARRLDLVQWWAEIFEVPVVAFDAASPEEARELAAAGADFIAVRIPSGMSDAEVAAALGAIVEAVSRELESESGETP